VSIDFKPEPSPELRPDLLDDFFFECDEHLKRIREALVALENSVGRAQADRGVVEELFQNFHSLKGISAIVGLRAAERLAHAAEGYFRELTRGRVSLTPQGLETLVAATQRLEQIAAAFHSKSAPPESESLVASLSDLAGRETGEASPPTEETEANQTDRARANGLVLWRCVFIPAHELDERGININTVRTRLSEAGEILRVTPQVRGEGAVAFEFLLGTKEAPPEIARWEADGIFVELLDQSPSVPVGLSEGSASRSTPENGGSPFIAPSHVVRVDLQKLDELMRITGELVIHRSHFEEQLTGSIRAANVLDPKALQEVNAAMARSLRELRQALMRVRMVPVAEIFARMPFVVRDLARDSQKKVRLALEGQQTQLDKYLIERLKDPLLHLVRNAFSHAVETPEERLAAGKPPEASIVLAASTVGDSVVIQVGDDGRGVDPNIVAQRASSLGLTVPATLDNSALLQILCSPGFSTRADADRVSGRGVGMSVVCRTVRELGGAITLDTTVGKGTRFTLRLPLTLALSETLIVSGAEQTCAIPQSFVNEIIQVEEQQVRWVNRVEVIPYRSGVLPIVRLSSLFRATASRRERSYVLVLSSERGSTGLVVDRVHGQKEVVVRAIRDPLVQVPGVVGATELGDGRPVLILDGVMLTSGPVRPHSSACREENGIERTGHEFHN
jgi:two-component system chemotaxis sensor kinase CheA